MTRRELLLFVESPVAGAPFHLIRKISRIPYRDTKTPLMVQRQQRTDAIFFRSLEKVYIDGRSLLHKWEDTAVLPAV
jgi:hypothetical protein